jgi:hypothetical protein
MRRLMEMDVADSVRASVIAGPADLMTWEVSACIDDSDGMTLDVIGRGVDLEAAAASTLAVLTENGSTLRPPIGQLEPATPDPEIQDLEQPMHPPAARVIYRHQPYLLELNRDGLVVGAFGPFTPGTEPSLAECGPGTQVQDPELVDRLARLLPSSPGLPAAEDTLAGS